MKRTDCFTILICLIGFGNSLYAQPDSLPPVELTIRFFPIHRQNIDGLFLNIKDGEFVPVEFRQRVRSLPYEYVGPRNVTVYSRRFDPETAAYVYTPAFTAYAPSMEGDLLILVMPPGYISSQELKNTWMVIPLDDSADVFKAGEIRVINATGFNLEGMVGTNRVSLGFGISDTFRIDNNSGWLDLGFAIKVRENYELVYGNRLQFDRDSRSILILRPPRRERSIKIATYFLEDNPEIEATIEQEAVVSEKTKTEN